MLEWKKGLPNGSICQPEGLQGDGGQCSHAGMFNSEGNVALFSKKQSAIRLFILEKTTSGFIFCCFWCKLSRTANKVDIIAINSFRTANNEKSRANNEKIIAVKTIGWAAITSATGTMTLALQTMTSAWQSVRAHGEQGKSKTVSEKKKFG